MKILQDVEQYGDKLLAICSTGSKYEVRRNTMTICIDAARQNPLVPSVFWADVMDYISHMTEVK